LDRVVGAVTEPLGISNEMFFRRRSRDQRAQIVRDAAPTGGASGASA
jgi:hypothetical protein